MKILVMSCDKNQDLFDPFHYCTEKYWNDHPEIIYSTETKINPYYKTICKKYDLNNWTRRVRETVQEIVDDFILLMVDDIFIRNTVNNSFILNLVNYITDNVAAINFENHFDDRDEYFNDILKKRCQNGRYKTSMMCQLWHKPKLLQVLNNIDVDPWKIEQINNHLGYIYLVNSNKECGLLPFGKIKGKYEWGIVRGKWTSECIDFFNKENYTIDYSKRGCLNMTKCFGIISYFPWEQPQRQQRQDRLDRLISQLSELWPDVPIIVIAQQWKLYNLENKCKNKVYRYDYEPLGILGARNKLREKFFELGFDYLIMFDDDAIIQCDTLSAAQDYINEIDKHPNGFAFVKGGNNKYCPYVDSQLNLCAISRFIYQQEPIPNINAQNSEGFEDRIWSTLLHYKYSKYEFDLPSTIRSCHFKNPNINMFGGEVPSTWATQAQYNWKNMREQTLKIEKYIVENKELPEWIK